MEDLLKQWEQISHQPDALSSDDIPVKILLSSFASGRVSHAYLFYGPPGSRKDVIAAAFTRLLLCEKPAGSGTNMGCGDCWSCREVALGSHPDLHVIRREGTTIKIKASHEIIREATTKPFRSSRKVFLIEGAEDLTAEASNALLKVLEEPPPHIVFILTCRDTSLLPETIVSRCQAIPFRRLSFNLIAESIHKDYGFDVRQALKVIEFTGGNREESVEILSGLPGVEKAAEGQLRDILHGSPVELAYQWSRLEPEERTRRLSAIEFLLFERLSICSSAEAEIRSLYEALKAIAEARRRLKNNTNAFLTLAVLFLQLSRCLSPVSEARLYDSER